MQCREKKKCEESWRTKEEAKKLNQKIVKSLIFKRFGKTSRGEKKIWEGFRKNLWDLYYVNSRCFVIVSCLILFGYQFILSENVFFCVFLYIFFKFIIKFCRIFKRLPNVVEWFGVIKKYNISVGRHLVMLSFSSNNFFFTS